ncbi:hypothetical protein [Actinoplanes palleronii]|uniref:Uncharacterized protein n=1 Tax=Actinoplanes palleronii TaxID=113570 RepID=A0ABQ4BRR0_9ACTN|nr:hypothetical protein [Actinoplanes palleronii]GIE73320.1 hypothetical protein Apa02nite_094280 [Actinoplanes palleronii]
MSWSLFVIPLHQAAHGGVMEWAAAATPSRGFPSALPAPVPLPTVAGILVALDRAGCHGDPWFQIRDADAAPPLLRCPDPAFCARNRGRDLGEVSLHGAEQAGLGLPLSSDTRVETVSLRKPSRAGTLAAACAIASAAGPQLIFDDSGDQAFIVWPGESEADLAQDWPW